MATPGTARGAGKDGVLITAAGFSRAFRNWWDAVPWVRHRSGNATKRRKKGTNNEGKKSIQTTLVIRVV
jgi:hypothetical protein